MLQFLETHIFCCHTRIRFDSCTCVCRFASIIVRFGKMSVLDKNHRQTQGQVESGDGYLKLHLSAGTYDHALYGYHCTITRSKASSEGVCACSLTKSFVLEAHSAPVTAAAADGRFVVTGSVDELIRYLCKYYYYD